MPVPMRQRVHRRPGERPVHQVRSGSASQRRLRGERGRRALQERRLGPVVEAPGRPRPQPDLGHRDPADPAGVRLRCTRRRSTTAGPPRSPACRCPPTPGRRGRGRSFVPPTCSAARATQPSASASRCDPGRSRCSSARTADRQEPGCRGPLDAIRPHDGDGWGASGIEASPEDGRTPAGTRGSWCRTRGTRPGLARAGHAAGLPASSAPSLSRPRSRRSCSPRSGTRPFVDLLASRDEVFYEADIQEYPTQPVTWKIAWTQFPARTTTTTTNIEGGKSRVPFVVTNDRAGGFDLWLGTDRCGECRVLRTRPAMRHGSDHVEGELHGPPRGMDGGPRGLR